MNVSLLISLVLQRAAHPRGSNNKVLGAEYAGVLISQAATTAEWVCGWVGVDFAHVLKWRRSWPRTEAAGMRQVKTRAINMAAINNRPPGSDRVICHPRTRTFLLLSARACIAAPANNDKANERRRLMLQRQFLRPLQLLRLFAIWQLLFVFAGALASKRCGGRRPFSRAVTRPDRSLQF